VRRENSFLSSGPSRGDVTAGETGRQKGAQQNPERMMNIPGKARYFPVPVSPGIGKKHSFSADSASLR